MILLPLLALFFTPTGAQGQTINVLDIARGTTSANLKAEIDLEGKTIQSVLVRTFKMSDGSSTICDQYKILDGRYIIADLDYHPGNDYFYRLEVTFTDGTIVKTDCLNETLTEGAVWLSDLPVTSSNVTNVAMDKCANGTPIQIHPNSIFHKGISAQSPGLVHFDLTGLNRNFTSVKFTFGLQAFKEDGSNSAGFARVIFMMNGAETSSKGNMYAYSNPSRKSSPYYFDQTQTTAAGIRNVSLKMLDAGGTGNTDDFCNLAACRLYYAIPASDKQPQTVTFDTPGGTIFKDSPQIDLSAYSSGGTDIYFTLVQGSDLADIKDGHILVPRHGKGGEIVVDAFTPGNETYSPASATQTFNFNFGPTVKYLYTHKNTEDNSAQTIYLYVEPQDKQLEKLNLEIYDDVRSFKLIKTMNLLSDLQSYATPLQNVYAIPVQTSSAATLVHRLIYKFANEDEITGHLGEGDDSFIYMSDLPTSIRTGWGSPNIDKGYGETGVLRNNKYSYGKGYGVHGAGYVETTTATDLSAYSRFVVDVGGQVITNPTRGRLSFSLLNGVSTPYLSTGNVSWTEVFEWDFPLAATGSGKTVKLVFGDGGDGNTNDVVCIGAPRFYYNNPAVNRQTVEWQTEERINNYKPFVKKLTATSSSGLPVIYRISSGSEYARIRDNRELEFYNIPEEGDVVVEAFQPGDKEHAHSNVCTCVFHIRKALIIGKDERVELEGGHDIDELVVYADANSAGQAIVSSGIVNVKKLVLKYSFVPGEWNYISFPSDLDLDMISDLNDKGFFFNVAEDIPGTFLIREYDTRLGAEDPDASPWTDLESPKVKGMKGYIMKLDDGGNTDPVDITFTMDNVELDFENTIRPLYLTLDMTECMPESRHTVYVRPSNVKGNTLRVDVRFSPSDLSELPVNHARALEEMRVTHTPVRGAIRLTLPEQTPARVAIYDKEGKHLIKAVRYVSPMKINISDIAPGTYRLVVVYGPASTERLVEL